MKIYLASSWRNARQPAVLAALRAAGHEVYDFRNPAPGNSGFGWRQCDPRPPAEWSVADYLAVLDHPVARAGFKLDMDALRGCEVCVLVLPCGRSAHLELGWAAGAGKRTIVLCEKLDEPELMYLACDRIVGSVDEMIGALAAPGQESAAPPAQCCDIGRATSGNEHRQGCPAAPSPGAAREVAEAGPTQGVCDIDAQPHNHCWLCLNWHPTPPAVAGPKEGA